MAMTDISDDVVIDILPRLPVKSLMRFNSVCKAWHALFRNPDFISMHSVKRAALCKSNTPLLVKRGAHGENCLTFISSTANHDGSEKTLWIKEIIYLPIGWNLLSNPRVVGPCNGLLCLFEHTNPVKIVLWNPATREFKPLPLAPIENDDSSSTQITFCEEVGFGFDSKSNDYKVIMFISDLKGGRRRLRRAELYSLKRDCWKEIPSWRGILPAADDIVFDVRLSSLYVDGVYYWLMVGDHTDWIMSFNMADEVFDIMPLSNFSVSIADEVFERTGMPASSRRGRYRTTLAILDGSIHAFLYPRSYSFEDYFVYIWVMTENGVKESWIKQARIGPISRDHLPVGFWESGELCLEDSIGKLVLYDPGTQKVKNLKLHGVKYRLLPANYAESLVFINGRGEDEDKPIIRVRYRTVISS
ncbi:F-box and associated interaction domains-containing protein putative isoform 1 [Tripterygium wilfordii]|uniref:F-box and associated interaction domains-containing protein putative isoform 1 n=1 Tax=Tripterygium wilfordii TaxID=458696 RepID=A0A7J7CC12_TRIWF|nr:F-box/kelch-repeat protein At3g23880-like [Tripterygium wilfordii]KAF5731642.1 F-box and associated interaction domains-containing protein putative isoform 1 [Tripterygium wilfordii]